MMREEHKQRTSSEILQCLSDFRRLARLVIGGMKSGMLSRWILDEVPVHAPQLGLLDANQGAKQTIAAHHDTLGIRGSNPGPPTKTEGPRLGDK